MIDENTTLPPVIHAWIEAFNAHDTAAILALYENDAKLFDSGMKRSRPGRTAIERWFISRFRTMPELTYALVSHFTSPEGDVAITWTAQGRTPRFFGWKWIARPFRIDGVSVFTLHNGLIAQQRGYYDHIAVVEQGLPFIKWLVPRL